MIPKINCLVVILTSILTVGLCKDDTLKIRIDSLVKVQVNSPLVPIEFVNFGEDTIILPVARFKSILIVEIRNFYPRLKEINFIKPHYNLPCIAYSTQNDSSVRIECCESLRKNDEYYFLPPKSTFKYFVNINNFYQGLQIGDVYEIKIYYTPTENLKMACSKFWVGKIEGSAKIGVIE